MDVGVVAVIVCLWGDTAAVRSVALQSGTGLKSWVHLLSSAKGSSSTPVGLLLSASLLFYFLGCLFCFEGAHPLVASSEAVLDR